MGVNRLIISPKVEEIKEGENTTISISARTEDELRNILKGYQKKYPGFDAEEAMKKAERQKEYFKEPLNFKIIVGGEEVFKAVCKCAVNFFIYKGGDNKFIKHIIPYIKGKEEKEIVWLHYLENIYEINEDECFHTLHLVGNPEEHILYCYVDYFNSYKYIVLLNDNYDGPPLKETYCYDLINTQIVPKNIFIDYNRETLLSFFSNKNVTFFEEAQVAFTRTVRVALKRQGAFQRNQLIEDAINTTLGSYPEGTLITESMISEMSTAVAETIAEYIFRHTPTDITN